MRSAFMLLPCIQRQDRIFLANARAYQKKTFSRAYGHAIGSVRFYRHTFLFVLLRSFGNTAERRSVPFSFAGLHDLQHGGIVIYSRGQIRYIAQIPHGFLQYRNVVMHPRADGTFILRGMQDMRLR